MGWAEQKGTAYRKAVRGSGGVGLLIKEEVLESYTIEILKSDVEDILWVRIRQVEEEEDEALVVVVVCYIYLFRIIQSRS